ncbi:PepSY domain-containing protein [Corynebacterium gallinarum]|uniref:PepSY domain-containing protein n=1 Tax=Corynebacterium gallinarum TaxID=2762214 RepID=A0A8I0HIS0_9CORY|nr:PepSY domain-containing protein [Corynebacterium gallinarum]MBD8029845.1 PepSY domain-containing protein [Corynebacterium gallinarum]
MFTRKLFTLTAVAGLSLSLAACGDDSGNSDATATETTVVTSDDATTEETTTAEETTDSGVATETQTAVSDADATADRDIVFDAIDLVMAEHADGIIIDIDREDDTEAYEIDVVVGEEVLELDVDTAAGEVRESDRDNDDAEDVRRAQEATVTISDAITQALEAHPDGVVDEASLEDEDGRLEWQIDLDDVERNDLTEFTVLAN